MLIVLAAVGRPPRMRRLATALAALALAAALTAFWTWPLAAPPRARARPRLGRAPGISRLGWLLVILALLGLWRARGPAARVRARLPWRCRGTSWIASRSSRWRALPAGEPGRRRRADALILAAALGWAGLRSCLRATARLAAKSS